MISWNLIFCHYFELSTAMSLRCSHHCNCCFLCRRRKLFLILSPFLFPCLRWSDCPGLRCGSFLLICLIWRINIPNTAFNSSSILQAKDILLSALISSSDLHLADTLVPRSQSSFRAITPVPVRYSGQYNLTLFTIATQRNCQQIFSERVFFSFRFIWENNLNNISLLLFSSFHLIVYDIVYLISHSHFHLPKKLKLPKSKLLENADGSRCRGAQEEKWKGKFNVNVRTYNNKRKSSS